jgi:UDP-glucose 4-epimerase
LTILVTGGAGYIGSHTCVELQQAGYDVIVVDNLSNSKEISLEKVHAITGRKPDFVKADLLDQAALESIFSRHSIDAVIHFAGLKAVGESVSLPLHYYHNNITGSIILFKTMIKYDVKALVFSSSATVYGDPHTVPIKEDFPLKPTNPYGRTKLVIEEILKDIHFAHPDFNVALLRYFNPVGTHSSGLIGEDPNGIPNNLMPYISQVAVGKLDHLSVYADDYPTADGTGVRDYIHVVDLAIGHLKALELLRKKPGLVIYNLGTGRGYSVLQVLKSFEKASGVKIPYKIVDRRPGDIATCYADPGRAERELGWKATRDINDMCADTWRWQSNNPNGFE